MPADARPPKRIHALLGRRDEPTDGVADYSLFLAKALASRNIDLQIAQLPWFERGWPHALEWLANESKNWRGEWVLLQYTALAWSRRGFPVGALRAARILRANGARLGVVFHDAVGFEVRRLRDRARLRVQFLIMSNLYRRSERSILTVPAESVEWLPADHSRIAFIPIGANIPESVSNREDITDGGPPTIAVFSITGGEAGAVEVQDIARVARRARERLGAVRLEVFGRGAEMNRAGLERALEGSGVALRLRGILPAEEISRTLAACDVMLFLRGLAASRRGTFVAGLACGLPIVGFGETGTDAAIDAGGVCLAPWHDTERLAEMLAQILIDENLRRDLRERSRKAQQQYYSWDSIAARYVAAFGLQDSAP